MGILLKDGEAVVDLVEEVEEGHTNTQKVSEAITEATGIDMDIVQTRFLRHLNEQDTDYAIVNAIVEDGTMTEDEKVLCLIYHGGAKVGRASTMRQIVSEIGGLGGK